MFLRLQMAPTGFHSVCGTESHQRVPPVKYFAARGDRMAKELLQKGDVYGKQFVVFESYQAYPMYVVTYTCPDDFTPQLEPVRTQVGDVLRVTCIPSSSACTPVINSLSHHLPQRPMKWEHKAKSEKNWTPYSAKHTMQLSQAIMFSSLYVIFICAYSIDTVDTGLSIRRAFGHSRGRRQKMEGGSAQNGAKTSCSTSIAVQSSSSQIFHSRR